MQRTRVSQEMVEIVITHLKKNGYCIDSVSVDDDNIFFMCINFSRPLAT